jgi:hypothetical protein
MEDKLNNFKKWKTNGRRPHIFENGRRPQFFLMEDNRIFNKLKMTLLF